jgi:GGDEF domain-containing protein
MPGSQLDLVADALSANVRSDDWPARSRPTGFAVLPGSDSTDAETAANRLLEVVARREPAARDSSTSGRRRHAECVTAG